LLPARKRLFCPMLKVPLPHSLAFPGPNLDRGLTPFLGLFLVRPASGGVHGQVICSRPSFRASLPVEVVVVARSIAASAKSSTDTSPSRSSGGRCGIHRSLSMRRRQFRQF